VLAQLAFVASAVEGIGSVSGVLPFGRVVAVEFANSFSALAGGTAAVFATRVRFFQQQGYDSSVALSSGAIMATSSWIATAVLFLVSLPFAWGSLDLEITPESGGDSKLVWIILAVVLLAGLLAGLVLAVPRIRRLAAAKVRPRIRDIWGNLRQVASSPRKLVLLVGGSFAQELLVAMALSVSLRAFDDHLRLPVARRDGGRGSGPDPRPHRGGRLGGRRHRGRVHPAAVHLVPAAHLGLGHPGLDAQTGIPVTEPSLAVKIDSEKGHRLAWQAVVKRAVAVAIAGIAIYLVFPAIGQLPTARSGCATADTGHRQRPVRPSCLMPRFWSVRQQVHDQGENADAHGELECEDHAADSDGDQPASPGPGPPDVLETGPAPGGPLVHNVPLRVRDGKSIAYIV
jgi:hypothetical protein